MIFLEEFEENVESAGKALDQNGFDLLSYTVMIYDDEDIAHSGIGDSIESAYEEALDSIDQEDYFRAFLYGSQLVDCLKNEGSMDEVFARTVSAQIQLDEPIVEKEWGGEPAFQTVIEYVPANANPSSDYQKGYFEVGNCMVLSPYDSDDDEERIEEITQILESDGFCVKSIHK